MNWTSTQVPLWQIDCEEFRKAGFDFQLKNVEKPEHETFVVLFATRHSLRTSREGGTVTFHVRNSN